MISRLLDANRNQISDPTGINGTIYAVLDVQSNDETWTDIGLTLNGETVTPLCRGRRQLRRRERRSGTRRRGAGRGRVPPQHQRCRGRVRRYAPHAEVRQRRVRAGRLPHDRFRRPARRRRHSADRAEQPRLREDRPRAGQSVRGRIPHRRVSPSTAVLPSRATSTCSTRARSHTTAPRSGRCSCRPGRDRYDTSQQSESNCGLPTRELQRGLAAGRPIRSRRRRSRGRSAQTGGAGTGNRSVENVPGKTETWIVNDGIITDPNGRDVSANVPRGRPG